MACVRPVPFRGGAVLPCWRCEHCRKARAADLVTRLLVETLGHELACFVTLTYRTALLPAGRSLRRADARAFLKRFRRAVEYRGGGPLRVFLVGEYGTLSRRPHYHLIVWGADASSRWDGQSLRDLVRAAWGMGRVDVGTYWSAKAAGYVAGYVAKGLNVKGLDMLRGRDPEFSIFPKGKGGLGSPGLPALLRMLIGERDPRAVIEAHGDVPRSVDLAGTTRLLRGPFLDKLRQVAGLSLGQVASLKLVVADQGLADRLERGLDRQLGLAIACSDLEGAAIVGDNLAELVARPSPTWSDADRHRAFSKLLRVWDKELHRWV